MFKKTPQKRKPQQKKPKELTPLEYAFKHGNIVWVPNGIGFIPALIQNLCPERSNVKLLEGGKGYAVVHNLQIRTERPE